MGWDCPTDPDGVADTDGPFLDPFTLAQEPDTIAIFAKPAQANNNSFWLACQMIVATTKKKSAS